MERTRVRDRIRNQSRANSLAALEQDSSGRRGQDLVPVTRTSIFQGTEVGGIARVHLNPFPPLNYFSREQISRPDNRSDISYAGGCQLQPSTTDGVIGSPTPFSADPLPMPLGKMIPVSQIPEKDPPRIIRVAPNADIAGR